MSSPWDNILDEVPPARNLAHLPLYAFQYVFQNLGPFRRPLFLFLFCRVLEICLKFYSIYLLSDLISNATILSAHEIFTFYFPAWFIIAIACEGLDYPIRKYGESFSTIYVDYTSLRFARTLILSPSPQLLNYSKDRLLLLLAKYTSHLNKFFADLFWSLTTRATQLVIISGILIYQSPVLFLFAFAFFILFLLFSFRLSRNFSQVASEWTEQSLESSSTISSILLQLNTLQRFRLEEFFLGVARGLLKGHWSIFHRLRTYHANRWLIQLSLFQLLQITILTMTAVQVTRGSLPLGYLVLIKWAFDQLWQIVVYAIEYYVHLVQQKEDTLLIRREIQTLIQGEAVPTNFPHAFQGFELLGVHCSFQAKEEGGKPVEISIPRFELQRGERIGIVGPSGAGKSTLLNILLGLQPYQGSYRVDKNEVVGCPLLSGCFGLVTSLDPLFKLTLRDNILLGRSPSEEHLSQVLEGLCILEFQPDLDARIGGAKVHLSAGQEQRIRLARGVLEKPSVLLLDEPFTGIDTITKRKILAFLDEYLHNTTVVLVTHIPEELSLVHKVYEMKDGVLHLCG
jgi:ABC-type bacteriocin/lantibiotic exporter with double-glycine peptidase domain